MRVKRKKLGTPEVSPKAGEADTPGMPSFASRIPKTVPLAGLFSSRIYSLESAKGFLKDHGVLDNNQVIDIPVICAALSVLSDSPHRSISTLTDRMKSVCFLLKEMDSTTLMIDNGDKDEPVIRELTEQRAMLARLESTIAVMAAHSQGEMRDLKRGLEETKNNVCTFMHGTAGPSSFEAAFPAPPTTVFPAAVKSSYAAALIHNSERQHASAIAKGND